MFSACAFRCFGGKVAFGLTETTLFEEKQHPSTILFPAPTREQLPKSGACFFYKCFFGKVQFGLSETVLFEETLHLA